MSSVGIYVLGIISGLAMAFIVIAAMVAAIKKEREHSRKEHARFQNEKDAAFERGYNRALSDQRRFSRRNAAEQFADTFEGRRVQFRTGGAAQ